MSDTHTGETGVQFTLIEGDGCDKREPPTPYQLVESGAVNRRTVKWLSLLGVDLSEKISMAGMFEGLPRWAT